MPSVPRDALRVQSSEPNERVQKSAGSIRRKRNHACQYVADFCLHDPGIAVSGCKSLVVLAHIGLMRRDRQNTCEQHN